MKDQKMQKQNQETLKKYSKEEVSQELGKATAIELSEYLGYMKTALYRYELMAIGLHAKIMDSQHDIEMEKPVELASYLGVTKGAVSQYPHNERELMLIGLRIKMMKEKQ